MNRRVVDSDVLMSEYRELLKDEKIEALPLVVSGNSMSPFLVSGRDTVYLSRVTKPIQKGDILLYERSNGQFVLHRVKKVGFDSLVMIGDGQVVCESGIMKDQVIAIVSAVLRKDVLLDSKSFLWWFFAKIWICVIPYRRLLIKAVHILR